MEDGHNIECSESKTTTKNTEVQTIRMKKLTWSYAMLLEQRKSPNI